MLKRDLILVTALLIFISLSVAQPSLPHRVYGEFTDDSDGSQISGLNVTFNASGNIVATQNTSSEGFYDLYIQGLSSGENVYLFADGSNTTEYVNFMNGSSTALNCRLNSSDLCVDTSGDDSEGTENDDNTDDTNNDNNNDDDPGGSGGSPGGGGGGGSAPTGGGFAPVPDGSVEVSSELKDGKNNISVGEVDKDQFVEIDISGADYLDGFSFTTETSGHISVFIESSKQKNIQSGVSEIFQYFEVNVSGIDSFSNASLGYTLPDSILAERNVSADDISVVLDRGGSWQSIDNSVTYEGISSQSFRADSGAYDGIFGVKIPLEQQESDNNNESDSETGLQVQSLTVTPLENETAAVNIVAVNNQEDTLNDTIELYKDGEVIKEWSLSLESMETRKLSYSSQISGSELHRFSAGSESTSIGSQNPNDDEDNGIPVFLIVIATFLVIVAGLIIYVYIIEYRRANELDEVIEDIERKGNQVNDEVGEMKDNMRNLRDNVRGNRDNRDKKK